MFYKVKSSDINDLSDFQLTRLLNLLLHLEAKSSGIAERAVDVALNINVLDGGEDGRIQWNDGHSDTNYLPSTFVQFQIKAKKMRAADCAEEILGANGMLKPMLESALSNGAAYIIFNNQHLKNVKRPQ
jgi:hypothetical protein